MVRGKRLQMSKRLRPSFFWWVWWTPLQDKEAGASVTWSAKEMGVPEEPAALKTAHSSLIRAGQTMYNRGLLKYPVRTQKRKGSDGTIFLLTLGYTI